MSNNIKSILIDKLLDKNYLDIALAIEQGTAYELSNPQKQILEMTISEVKLNNGFSEHEFKMGIAGTSCTSGNNGRSLSYGL